MIARYLIVRDSCRIINNTNIPNDYNVGAASAPCLITLNPIVWSRWSARLQPVNDEGERLFYIRQTSDTGKSGLSVSIMR